MWAGHWCCLRALFEMSWAKSRGMAWRVHIQWALLSTLRKVPWSRHDPSASSSGSWPKPFLALTIKLNKATWRWATGNIPAARLTSQYIHGNLGVHPTPAHTASPQMKPWPGGCRSNGLPPTVTQAMLHKRAHSGKSLGHLLAGRTIQLLLQVKKTCQVSFKDKRKWPQIIQEKN